jgi:hypothetical protein
LRIRTGIIGGGLLDIDGEPEVIRPDDGPREGDRHAVSAQVYWVFEALVSLS